MAEINRRRVIRPSTRQNSSINYKVDVEGISKNDHLIVEITHESKPFRQCFKFEGKDLIGKKSIHFQVVENPSVRIIWKEIQTSNPATLGIRSIIKKSKLSEITSKQISNSHPKTSLPAIEDPNIKFLILGTMPGEQSLLTKQYYANPQNRFWNIISVIIGKELPSNYHDRRIMLLGAGIGLWDVLHTANRKSSLDNEIKNGTPNDLENFLATHRKLQFIVFNGKKAKTLYDRHFVRGANITNITLPSSSPANTSFTYQSIIQIWQQNLLLK